MPDWKPIRTGEGLLIHGDNLEVLTTLASAWGSCVDLIYVDPPFGSGKVYDSQDGSGRPARGFRDLWPLGLEQYIGWLSGRLEIMRELLADRGSLMLHLDAHAVHYLKIEMDRIFGRKNFLNEIIWHYTGGGRSRSYFSRKHDTILWYRKGKEWTFHIDAVRVPYEKTSGYARSGIVSARGKRYLPNPLGTPVDDVWRIPMVNPLSTERTGYPTQKPEALLERILKGCSSLGQLVADPFCGSGTTGVVAARLGRRWLLCDDSINAVTVARKRIGAGNGKRARRETVRPPAISAYRFQCAGRETTRSRDGK